MLNIAICEDQLECMEYLELILTKLLIIENINYKIYKFNSGESLLENMNLNFDLIFLDIILGGIDGIEVSKKIRKINKDVEIIFTTNEIKFALKGYKVRAYRYFIKPINIEDVEELFKSYLKDYDNDQEKICIKTEDDNIFIKTKDILYAEVNGKVITIHTQNGLYSTNMRMKNLESKLSRDKFLRCHHSFVINLDRIEKINKTNLVINDDIIPISRSKMSSLKCTLAELLGEKL